MAELLSEKQVRHVAKLARLHLDDRQIELYRSQLASVLQYVDKLGELNLEGVEPLSHPIELSNRLAADEIAPSLPVESVLSGAPQVQGPYIAVPRILDDTGG